MLTLILCTNDYSYHCSSFKIHFIGRFVHIFSEIIVIQKQTAKCVYVIISVEAVTCAAIIQALLVEIKV